MVRCRRRIGGGMRRSRRSRSGTGEWRTWLGSLAATRTRCDRAKPTSPLCPRTRLLAASEKKGGRKSASMAQPGLTEAVQEAVADRTAGSPVDPDVQWTNRSPQEIAEEVAEQGFVACADT